MNLGVINTNAREGGGGKKKKMPLLKRMRTACRSRCEFPSEEREKMSRGKRILYRGGEKKQRGLEKWHSGTAFTIQP